MLCWPSEEDDTPDNIQCSDMIDEKGPRQTGGPTLSIDLLNSMIINNHIIETNSKDEFHMRIYKSLLPNTPAK